MKRVLICFSLLALLGVSLPQNSTATVSSYYSLGNTMSRTELNQVMGECVKVFCMPLNDLYAAYGRGELQISKVNTGIFSVQLSGGGSILILLNDA